MKTPMKKLILAAFAATAICRGARAADITEGLVAYYPFDGDTADASGNGYHLSGTAATWSSDRNGNESAAASFSGSGYLTPSPMFNASDSLTFAAWVKAVVEVPAPSGKDSQFFKVKFGE